MDQSEPMTQQAKQVALITGVSSGIGRATALRLSNAGYRVFGTSRRQIVSGSADIEDVVLDVTLDGSVTDGIAEVLRQAGRIDVLVNNAGIGITGGAEESSPEQARVLFETNVFGAMRVTNAVLPQMRRQGRGRIINIGSVLGFIPAPFSAIYAATKHALEGYSESLDHEMRGQGIRISLIEPAYTRTSFEANMLRPDRPMPEYDAARKRTADLLKDVLADADEPSTVADVVLKAVRDPRPKHRYPAGKLASRLAVVRRFVPASMFDSSLRKQMRLDV